MRLRTAVMRGDKRDLQPGVSIDERALSQAKRTSAQWQRDFARGVGDRADPDTAPGILLSWAYPDRIGRARGQDGRYLLSNGRGARFAEPQALSKSEFIVAAELDGAEREARIFLAAPIALSDLEEYSATLLSETADIHWSEREGAVIAQRQRRLGALLLNASDIKSPDADAIHSAAMQGLTRLGVAALPWNKELRQWQARVQLLRHHAVPAPTPWPDVSDPRWKPICTIGPHPGCQA